SPYGYVPTEWITLMFFGLFAVSTLTHFFQAFYYRVWWLLPTAFLAGVLECAGWAARFWSSQKPALLKPYIIQTTATIIGPTPLLATNFIILEKLIHLLGPQYSRLPPKLYGYIFLSCDLVALTVQAYGGTVASKAVSDHKDPETGGHIMLGGIIFQMIAIIVYVILATEFFFRLVKNRPLKKDYTEVGANRKVEIPMPLKSMIGGLVFMTTCIFIRSIYRTVELIDGFTGKIIETQILFNLFDGAMIVLAIYALNYFHPGRLLAQ
ncbi:lipid-translocating exporter, partial [Heterobasidion irregulare TC 32-1]